MTDAILVATSLVPGSRIELQQRAIESWLNCGYDVVSYNNPAEIGRLAGDFFGISFEPMIRTGGLWSGKPVLFVSDVLHALKQTGRSICGIVNSDIIMQKNPDFLSCIHERANAGLVYGPRLDIDSLQDSKGEMDRFGADFFFFDRAIIDSIPESHLCLGMPYWDHWFPLMALLAGHQTSKLTSPFARHIKHPTFRDDSFFMFADEFIQQIVAKMDAPDAQPAFRPAFRIPDAQRNYALLKSAAIDAQQGDPKGQDAETALQALAGFIDEISRYVVLYTERTVRHMSIG